MQILVMVVHIVVCVILIVVVLLQAGKGASMGAAFGGSSQTIFGSAGPTTFLGKMTTLVAIVFMLTSLGLSYFAAQKGSTVLERRPLSGKSIPSSRQVFPRIPSKPSSPPAGLPAAPAVPHEAPVTPAK